MTDIPLQCHCGAVKGIARNASPTSGNRLVCYCRSCQAFAQHLAQNSQTEGHQPVLDADGGTEVFQMPPARLQITVGSEYIACLKLSPKGTFRWYTRCCHTPIGNTLGAGVPFIGLIHSFIRLAPHERQQVLGNVQGYIYARHATGTRITATRHSGMPLSIALKIVSRLCIWKLRGLNRPTPLFNSRGHPIATPEIILHDIHASDT